MITDYKNNVRSGKCRGNCVNGFGAYTWDNGDYFERFLCEQSDAARWLLWISRWRLVSGGV